MNNIHYIRGLREGLELTGRHTRLNLLFAFSLGFLLALALTGLFGGAV